jgi:allantoinase
MALPDSYLVYPHRRPGLDHDRFDYMPLFSRRPVTWPGGARVALWIVPALELFPLEMAPNGFRPPGSLDRPYPDYWNYTLRDYGNRVGWARLSRVLAERNLPASVAVSARLVDRYPDLFDDIVRSGHEIVAHGLDMAHLHVTGVPREEEARWVEEAVDTLRRRSGQPVEGWLSPAHSESHHTLDLVAAAGCRYVCDWVNDDMPYPVRTTAGEIHAMPHAYEIGDLQLFHFYKYGPEQFAEQVLDHFQCLYREAGEHGGRIMALSLRPWLSGVPHRIAAIENVLDRILRHAGIWPATGAEILAHWRAQQGGEGHEP